MNRKLFNFILLMLFVPFFSGCLALLAGAGGTALWQSGKIISEENVSMERGVKAVESVFEHKKILLTEKVTQTDVTQLRGKDQYEAKVVVDVFNLGPENCKFEIRYGLGEKVPALELLDEIKKRL